MHVFRQHEYKFLEDVYVINTKGTYSCPLVIISGRREKLSTFFFVYISLKHVIRQVKIGRDV